MLLTERIPNEVPFKTFRDVPRFPGLNRSLEIFWALAWESFILLKVLYCILCIPLWENLEQQVCFVTCFAQRIKRQSCYPIETSQLICRANQLTGLYKIATLAFNELMTDTSAGCIILDCYFVIYFLPVYPGNIYLCKVNNRDTRKRY